MSDSARRELAAGDVAAWLREHPAFFSQYPDVALAMDVPREDGRTTSLASYQLDALREKNRELNRRLLELYGIANENERLTVRTHQLTLALLRAGDAHETLGVLVASLREDFHGQWVRLLLTGPRPGVAHSPWWQVLAADAPQWALFADFLEKGEPLCGRLQPEWLAALFEGEANEVQSSALLPLGRHGLLVIGSSDANRFYPGMGTFFLRLMAEAVDVALARFRA